MVKFKLNNFRHVQLGGGDWGRGRTCMARSKLNKFEHVWAGGGVPYMTCD